jgi:hypothetical protein
MVLKQAPVLAAPIRTMATLKCLACGHDNNVGDEACSSCSSSLNLKLCSACEAINANDAERCHSCNAEFRVEPEVVTFEMEAPPPGERFEEASPAGRTLPAVWQIAARQVLTRSTRSAAALAVLPLLAAGVAYYFYAVSQPTDHEPQPAPKVQAAQKSEPDPKPEITPSEPVRPQAPEPRQPHAPAVSGKIVPSKAAAASSRTAAASSRTAAAPSRSTPPSEPKRTTAAVTHTRAPGAEASSRTTAADTPIRTNAAAALPVVATRPVPAANVAILPVSEAPAAIPEGSRMSVTHTKAVQIEAAVGATAPAVTTEARAVPAEARSEEPAGCAPAVVALGLCKSK